MIKATVAGPGDIWLIRDESGRMVGEVSVEAIAAMEDLEVRSRRSVIDERELEIITKFCGHAQWHDPHTLWVVGDAVFNCPGYAAGVQLENGRPVGWMK